MRHVDCRFAGELIVVRDHRIRRNLSDGMLDGCAAEVTVSDCPHGQYKRIVKWDLPLKIRLPMAYFSQIPIVTAKLHGQGNLDSEFL